MPSIEEKLAQIERDLKKALNGSTFGESMRAIDNKAMDMYYADYSPRQYQRTRQLYKMYEYQSSGDTLKIYHNPSSMSHIFESADVTEESVYQGLHIGRHGKVVTGTNVIAYFQSEFEKQAIDEVKRIASSIGLSVK